jgi:predicted HicB family RNase H-like nuclease
MAYKTRRPIMAKKSLNVLIPSELHEQLKKAAKADYRSVTSYLIKIISDKIEEQK